MAKLTAKQQRFVDEYLIDLNATQAAIRAGYSAKTAYSMGQRLLKHVEIQAAIVDRQKALSERTEITQVQVVNELASIAFANGADFAQVVRGVGVYITPTDQLPPEKLPAIASIKEGANGIEVKTYDKLKALELLGKHLGLFTDRVQISGGAANNLFDAIDHSTEAIRDGISELQPKAAAGAELVEPAADADA